MSNNFDIHTLGCGSAKPTGRHNPSCTVIDYHSNLFMIDCGEGSQKNFQKQRLKFSRLQHIFITHTHGDHVFGLPGLMGTLALSGIEGEIVIHTHKEGAAIFKEIFNYFNRELPVKAVFNIIDPFKEEQILETRSLKVRTLPLKHRIPCVGYIMEEKGKLRHLNREMCDFHGVPMSQFNNIKAGKDFVKDDGTIITNDILTLPPDPPKIYAHIGDTAFAPQLAERVGPVDLLYHESTYLSDKEEKAKARGHATAAQAATFAKMAGAKRLLLGHYSSSVKDDTLFLEEARAIFPDSIISNEGLKIPV